VSVYVMIFLSIIAIASLKRLNSVPIYYDILMQIALTSSDAKRL